MCCSIFREDGDSTILYNKKKHKKDEELTWDYGSLYWKIWLLSKLNSLI